MSWRSLGDKGAWNDEIGVGRLLVNGLEAHRDGLCIRTEEEAFTGGEVLERFHRYADVLRRHGVGPGSAVAVLSRNRPEVLFTIGAGFLAGVRRTSLHPLGSVDDHLYVLNDAGVEFLFIDEAFADRIDPFRGGAPGLKEVFVLGSAAGGVDLAAEAAALVTVDTTSTVVSSDAVSVLNYTGGTTGRPKGVITTYAGSTTMARIQLAEWEWPSDLRHLVCTPLSHAGAAFFVPVVLRGGSLHVLPQFDAEAVLQAIEAHRITSIMLVPTMVYALLDHPKLDDYDTSSLQRIYYGASAMSPARLREALERFGPVMFQFYGQVECPMTISVLRTGDHDLSRPERLLSCGRPVPWVQVALLGDDGRPVAPGAPGEICVRGDLCMAGYWNRPAETADATEFGWLHTGDIATQDDDGFLYIVDRKKDMVVSGGFNVFPREVEDVLSAHPAVAQAAVIGVPDERWGEAVTAVVVLRPGARVEEDELRSLVKEQKGAIHTPKHVLFRDAIPLTALGKPDKKVLREEHWAGAARAVN